MSSFYLKIRDKLAATVDKGWFQIPVQKNDGSGGVVVSQAEVISIYKLVAVLSGFFKGIHGPNIYKDTKL
jgi:hypothetical protein